MLTFGTVFCLSNCLIVADGQDSTAQRLERVLTVDPGLGVARHVDAGYDEAIRCAKDKGIHIPMNLNNS